MTLKSTPAVWSGPVKALSRHTAIQLIEQRLVSAIELEYAGGWKDVEELNAMAEPHGIGVTFRATEAISVPTFEALTSMLHTPKVTHRKRFLLCEFDIEELSEKTLYDLETIAFQGGDFILPADFFSNIGMEPANQIH